MNDTLETFLKSVAILGVLALFLVALTTLAGCNKGSEIPIDPIIDCEVADECVETVIDEFCVDCPDPVVCPEPTPPECFVRHVERVKVCPRTYCLKWGDDCCTYEKVVTFEPIACPEPEDVVVQ